MSRIGKQPIEVPAGTKVSIEDGVFVAKGPKGEVRQTLMPDFPVEIEGDQIAVSRRGESGTERARHGLLRALLANAVEGVSTGFRRELEINGVGYRAEVKGREVHFALGYSHPVIFPIPDGVKIDVDKSGKVTVEGADKQVVGETAAKIRSLRKPDPYKSKGIKYADEIVRRKVGKAGVK